VLGEVDGHPVVAREDNLLVAAFHPELTDDLRLHALFLALADTAAGGGRAEAPGLGSAEMRTVSRPAPVSRSVTSARRPRR
jgi:hypothetical protein